MSGSATRHDTLSRMSAENPITRETERQALPWLRSVSELTTTGRIRCSDKTKRPAATSVGAIAEVLSAGDFYPDLPIASYAWPLLLQAGGLAHLTGTKLQLTSTGRVATGNPTATTIRDLWRRWLTHGVIDEFSRIEEIKGQRRPNVLTAVTRRRATVAEGLTTCPVGEWIAVDELFHRMRRRGLNPTIARGERALFRLYIGHVEHGSLGYAGFHDWPILEGRYTLAVLFEYAATLGLIDVQYVRPEGARTDYHQNWGDDDRPFLSRYDGLVAIRLNPLGAFATGVGRDYTAAETTPATPELVTVQANSISSRSARSTASPRRGSPRIPSGRPLGSFDQHDSGFRGGLLHVGYALPPVGGID